MGNKSYNSFNCYMDSAATNLQDRQNIFFSMLIFFPLLNFLYVYFKIHVNVVFYIVLKGRSVMTKGLRSAQQVSSSSQGVHFLYEPGPTRVLLAHLGPQSALSWRWGFLESKKKKLYFILIYFNVFLCVLKLLYAFLKKVL